MSREWKKPNYQLPGWDYIRSGWSHPEKKQKKWKVVKGKWKKV